jgi:two-component system OmpR family response regulator
MATVLVIEDDPATAAEIAAALADSGHDVTAAATAAEALRLAGSAPFDAITLDRLLPDGDGLALLAALRDAGVRAPALVLSALGDVDQRIAGLRAGGDDYLAKPFDPDELAVRVEVLLRRGQAVEETALHVGAVSIDLIRREVSIDGVAIRLLPMEYRLLLFLARHAGRVISRRTLFEQVWGYHFDPGANLIKVHIARLRRKLDRPDRPSVIATVKGEGYRLDAG